MATYLLARGVPPADVLKRCDVSPSLMLDTNQWVDRRTSFRLSVDIARLTADPLTGLHVGELIQFADFGAWGAEIVRAPSLRSAIAVVSGGVHTVETGTRMELHEDGNEARLYVEFAKPWETDPREHIEGALMFLRKVLDLGVEPVPAIAHLPHPRPRGVDFERFFGPGTRLSQERAELVFDRGALALKLGPPPVCQVPVADTIARRVVTKIEELMDYESPTAVAVATALGINVRTMQRRLADWGLSFEMLLAEYRQRRARELLESDHHTVTDVAMRLGYSDPTHFARAFRRWTGQSPREARIASVRSRERGLFPQR